MKINHIIEGETLTKGFPNPTFFLKKSKTKKGGFGGGGNPSKN
jgi:hypothetical protein